MKDQQVIPILDLECTGFESLEMRCQKFSRVETTALAHGTEYPTDLYVASKMEGATENFMFDVVAERMADIRTPKGTLCPIPKVRRISITLSSYQLTRMDLKNLYAVLAYTILESKFIDELYGLFREECIEHTKRVYNEVVNKWMPII